MSKKSLLLYTDQKEVFESLSDEQAGRLIKAVFKYDADGEEPDLDPLLKVVFIPFRQALDRNREKYDHVCKRNADNIAKRWNKDDTKNTSGIIGIPKHTKNTNKDSDSDSNKDKDIILTSTVIKEVNPAAATATAAAKNEVINETAPPSLPTRGAGGRFLPKSGNAPRAAAAKVERAYWQPFVAAWFDFHIETQRPEPSFAGRDPLYLQQLYDRLKHRAEKKKSEWSEATAVARLRSFLTAAASDQWLGKKFLLKNLVSEFDAILQAELGKPRDLAAGDPREAIQQLYALMLNGKLSLKDISADYFDALKGLHELTGAHYGRAAWRRIEQLDGSNIAADLRLKTDYTANGAGATGPEAQADRDNLVRLAKRYAIAEFLETRAKAGTSIENLLNPQQ